MTYLRYLIFFTIIFFSKFVQSQELNCVIQINADQVSETDKRVYETMRTAIFEFMNNRKWTNYKFELSERVVCNILITIKKRNGDDFEGQIQVQSSRPIFNSSYNSTIFNHIDKDFSFNYTETDALEFNEGQISSNLTAVLSYYAYIILGIDFDSYSMYGGTPFYDKAQNIINLTQSRGEKGWKSYESQKNRYWLIENIYNKAYSPLREALYVYHRLGLDIMYDKQESGKSEIIRALGNFQKVNREKAGVYLLQIMIASKAEEIVNIFSEGSSQTKNQVVELMKDIDPSNSNKYNKIIKPE